MTTFQTREPRPAMRPALPQTLPTLQPQAPGRHGPRSDRAVDLEGVRLSPDRAGTVARILALAARNHSSDADLFSSLRKAHVTASEVRWLLGVPEFAHSPAVVNAVSMLTSFERAGVEPSSGFQFSYVEKIVRSAVERAQIQSDCRDENDRRDSPPRQELRAHSPKRPSA